MTRPDDLIYGVDERPPCLHLIFLGAQHAALMSVYLLLVVIVFRHAGAGDAATLNALSLGMVALAVSTMLQAVWKGPVGSGYLAPPVFSAIYIGPAVLAADIGGLSAVFAMTMFAGAVEMALAPLLRRLRTLFPPAISGFIVTIVGLQLGVIGIGYLLGVGDVERPTFRDHLMVGVLTLATMCALSVWGSGVVRLACSMFGMVVGMAGSLVLGLVSADSMQSFFAAPIFRAARAALSRLRFSAQPIPGFSDGGNRRDAAHCCVITTCQKINDSDWRRPDLGPIQGGIVRRQSYWDNVN